MRAKRFLSGILVLIMLLGLATSFGLGQGARALQKEETIAVVKPEVEPAKVQASATRPPLDFPFGPPDYDSGWITISGCQSVNHNLGGDPDDYVVDLMGRNYEGDTHYGFGGYAYETPGGTNYNGFFWQNLTSNSVQVCNYENFTFRLRIWIASPPAYDSGWITPSQNTTVLQHNLGGDVDDYWVYLEFDGGSDGGVNQKSYGTGAYWTDLNESSITVYRSTDLATADRFRVRIWRMPPPTYDSGWVDINTGDNPLDHGLGGPWNDFWVDLQFKQSDGTRTHLDYGGDCGFVDIRSGVECWGAYWGALTGSQIEVTRRSEDSDIAQARVRIWASRKPKFDSGWRDIQQDEALYIYHNLGGDPDAYVVNVVGKHPDWGINHIGYGGDTVSWTSGIFYTGVAWQNLTDTYLQVYRFSDDDSAHQVRARLWIAPFPDYDSGWRTINKDQVLLLQHNLGDPTDEYVVILDFKDDDLKDIHHFWYGGNALYYAGNLEMHGAYWYSLDSSYIYVHRGSNDTFADQVRVRIWRNSQADYASSWRYIAGSPYVNIEHNLGQPPESMVVDLQYQGTPKIHHHGYGRDLYKPYGSTLSQIGAYWSRLTSSSIRVNRGSDDTSISEVRVRIWLVEPYRVYLPLVLRIY